MGRPDVRGMLLVFAVGWVAVWSVSLSCGVWAAEGAFVAQPAGSVLSLEAKIISLGGTWKMRPGLLAPANLYQPTLDESDWSPVEVPSNWYLQGHELSGPVWFRRHFRLDANLQGKLVQLVFDGIDYAADVWLNGHYLGFHEGYFQPFRFLVAEQLQFDTPNVLVVRVDSPYEDPTRPDWSLQKRLIKGIFSHHDTRPGGAWSARGQDKNTGGIWAPVYLRVTDQVVIGGLRVTPELPAPGEQQTSKGSTATARVDLTFTHTGKKKQTFNFVLNLTPHNFQPTQTTGGKLVVQQTLAPGVHQLQFSLSCPNPHLWWSWDHGQPDLYQLEVSVDHKKKPLDTSQTVFGFRRIKYDPLSQEWHLNDRRIFLRGTNYISTQWLSEMTPDKYGFDIGLMKNAHINIVRVHAHIEAQAFYRLCDEAGLLIWQDFPLQWGYTEKPTFIAEAVRQAKDMVHLLYNHPSIVTWCLHNEPPWDAHWMQHKYPSYSPVQNQRLNDVLVARLTGVDPSRYLHPYSSTAEHPWLGWYSGTWQDYGKPSRTALITEFGAQALPDLTSLRKFLSEDELWPDSAVEWEKWAYHNFQRRETFEVAKVSQGETIQEFIANTQHYQARLIQFAAESYRRQKFNPVTAIFQFMLVEDWPSMNWGIVDYWRNPKPGYEALKIAYQPVLPSIAWSQERWTPTETVELELWVVNDLWRAFPDAQLRYTLRTKQSVIEQSTLVLDVQPDSARKVMTLTKNGLASDRYELIVQLYDAQEQLLGHNAFQFVVEENHDS